MPHAPRKCEFVSWPLGSNQTGKSFVTCSFSTVMLSELAQHKALSLLAVSLLLTFDKHAYVLVKPVPNLERVSI